MINQSKHGLCRLKVTSIYLDITNCTCMIAWKSDHSYPLRLRGKVGIEVGVEVGVEVAGRVGVG